MSLRRAGEELEYGEAQGMDTTSNAAVIPSGFVQMAWNFDIGLTGGYVKRLGHAAHLATAWTGRSVTAGIEYKGVSGTRSEVLFGTDGTASGGSLGLVSGGGVSSLATGLSGTARGSFVQLGKLLGYFNGSDAPVIYDGSAVRQMGITAPTNAPVYVSQSTSGSLTQGAVYSFFYTYYNSVTKAESSPSPIMTAPVLTGSNDEISFTVTAGDATTADTIRIWRTVGNGNEAWLEQTVTIATTTISSTTADAALASVLLEEDNSRVTLFVPGTNPTQALYPVVAQNRLFLKTDKEVVRYSKIGQSGAMLESFEVGALTPCVGSKGEGDEIIGLGKAGETPIILKEASVGRLESVGVPADFGVDPVRYVYSEISNEVGAVSHQAQCNVFGELVWLGRDNVYATDGRTVRALGDRVSATIKASGFAATQVSKLSAVTDTANSKVIFSFFADELETVPRYQLVGDYRRYPNFRWTVYRPGTDATTHPGLRPGCLYTARLASTGKQLVRMGNLDLNGQVYTLGNGVHADLGLGIYAKLKTRPYSMAAPARTKLFKDCPFQAKGDGNNYTLQVSAIYDFSSAEEDSQPLSLYTGGALWDAAIWDSDSWADEEVLSLYYQPHRKARFQQLVFTQTAADEPVEVLSWSTSGTVYGLE